MPQGPLVLRTKEEAAALLRVKVSWLERRAAARAIPFTLLGGCYLFTDEQLVEIIRLHAQVPKANGAPRARAVVQQPRRRAQHHEGTQSALHTPLRAKPGKRPV